MSTSSFPIYGRVGQKIDPVPIAIDPKLRSEQDQTVFTYGGLNIPPHSLHEARHLTTQRFLQTDMSPYDLVDIGTSEHLINSPENNFQRAHSIAGPWPTCTDPSPGPSMQFNRAPSMPVFSTSSNSDAMSSFASMAEMESIDALVNAGLSTQYIPSHDTQLPSEVRDFTSFMGNDFAIQSDFGLLPAGCSALEHGVSSSLGDFCSVSPGYASATTPLQQQLPEAGASSLSLQNVYPIDQFCTSSQPQSIAFIDPFPTTDFPDYGLNAPISPPEDASSLLDDDYHDDNDSDDDSDWTGSRRVKRRKTSRRNAGRVTKSYAQSRKRATKRPLNIPPGDANRYFNKYTSWYDVDCGFKGKRFRIEGDPVMGITWIPEETLSSHKAHRCVHLDDYGKPCGAAFERSEHLKRHVDSRHSAERKFPCPLPGCVNKAGEQRRIGRSDNAGDHFKTHLRAKPKGRRNQFYDWPTVRSYIVGAYEGKRANKLIESLQRWVDAGMPEPGGLKKRE